jgi:hypothetical protein
MSAAPDVVVALLLLAPAAAPAAAQSALRGSPIRLARSQAPIVIDGDLSDEGWRGATRIDTWYETQPGDNTEPKVRNVGDSSLCGFEEEFLCRGNHPRGSRHHRILTERPSPTELSQDNGIDLSSPMSRTPGTFSSKDGRHICAISRFASLFPGSSARS